MDPERRRVLRKLGIALAALAMGGCRGGREVGGDEPPSAAPVPPEVTPASESGWTRMRAAWVGLSELQGTAGDYEKGEALHAELLGRHQAALDELVAGGELREAVAGDMQVAYTEAATHVWNTVAPRMCYRPMPGPLYSREAKQSLADQSAALAEMAARSEIDEATVARARKAITRDMAFLALPSEERVAFNFDESRTYEQFLHLDSEASEDTQEAARILTEVLIGRRK